MTKVCYLDYETCRKFGTFQKGAKVVNSSFG
jgi:hypothetical protein